MARKRDLSPEFWESEQIAAVSRDARLLFVACISGGDDEGRIKASAVRLKGWAFRHDDDVSVADARGWRDELVAVGLLCAYKLDGVEYAHMPTWKRWQKVNRAMPSSMPACPVHGGPRAVEREPQSLELFRGDGSGESFSEHSLNAHAALTEHSLTTGAVPEPYRTGPVPAGMPPEVNSSLSTADDAGGGAPDGAATAAATRLRGTSPDGEREAVDLSTGFEAFNAEMDGLPGYLPDARLWSTLQEFAREHPEVKLPKEAMKMADWLRSSKNKRHATASRAFIVNWLDREADRDNGVTHATAGRGVAGTRGGGDRTAIRGDAAADVGAKYRGIARISR